jgi:hypothetical protein
LTMISINFIEALIIASIFYNLPASTASFFKRGGILFMMVNTLDVRSRSLMITIDAQLGST